MNRFDKRFLKISLEEKPFQGKIFNQGKSLQKFINHTILFFCIITASTNCEESLYNGLKLPNTWPPQNDNDFSKEYKPPPYLTSPPQEIDISTGRQLFVDDFLIEKTNCERKYHLPIYSNENPVMQATKTWEMNHKFEGAMPFSDGVWYDPKDSLFKMWYFVSNFSENKGSTALAISKDGINWEKPNFGIHGETNIVRHDPRDASTTWLNLDEPDSNKRFVHMTSVLPNYKNHALFYSKDGIHWGERISISAPLRDRSTFFYNPFRKVWVLSAKEAGPRRRYYRESSNLENLFNWNYDTKVIWQTADELDIHPPNTASFPELYNLDCVAYESILLGFFTIWNGNSEDETINKHNSVHLGYSRDGYHFSRSENRKDPFLPDSRRKNNRKGWNFKNIQSAGGGLIINNDSLRFYFSMRDEYELYTGLATLRRDGFVSMNGRNGYKILQTRPLILNGENLFINADADEGEIRVEVLNEFDEVIESYGYANSIPIFQDNTIQNVYWNGESKLKNLPRRVKFKFYINNADLYSFWVTNSPTGASYGYLAGGGPGYQKSYDDLGYVNSYQKIRRTNYAQRKSFVGEITIYNLSGRIIKSINTNLNRIFNDLDLNNFNLPIGQYVIVGQTKGQWVFSKRIIINGFNSKLPLKLW